MRGAWVFRDGELVPKSQAMARDHVSKSASRSDLPCPMIIPDRVEYRSTIDGSMITGRKQHRDHLKAHGCIEIGNEAPKEKSVRVKIDKDEIARDIKTAIEQVKAGYVPPEGPTHDEEGKPIETPEIEALPVGADIKDGDYIRSESKAKDSIIV